MSLTIPNVIQAQIDDLIKDKSSSLQATFQDLEEFVGYGVALESEWEMMWAVLQPYYPNESDFIPTIVNIVTTWCEEFVKWADDEANEAKVDRLLGDLKALQRMNLVLELNTQGSRPTTSWRSAAVQFPIMLPKAGPGAMEIMANGFSQDFKALYETSETAMPIRSKGANGISAQGGDFLPALSDLDGPGGITQKPPYRIIVEHVAHDHVRVFCSHERSLHLLNDYLHRWVKHSTNSDREPLAYVTLHKAVFGLGLIFDTLHVRAANGLSVNPMLVLTLVENALGYTALGTGAATAAGWEFKRLTELK